MSTVDVYLLHFDPPYKHAGHYLGIAKNGVERRYAEHVRGKGANIVAIAKRNGSRIVLARVWYGLPRKAEMKWKRNGHARRCPICCRRASLYPNRLATGS